MPPQWRGEPARVIPLAGGSLSLGSDPACDLAIGWTFFDGDAHIAFRDALPPRDLLAGVPVLNLFFEASTRTATSFTLAEQRVGVPGVHAGKIRLPIAVAR